MKRAYLIIVAGTLACMGLVFMIAPGAYFSGLSGIANNSGLFEMLWGFGGFYLGFAAWLFLALVRGNSIDAAIQSSVIVMSGIIIGRLAGAVAQGAVNPKIAASAGIELAFAAWGIALVLTTKKRKGNGQAHQSH